MRFSKNGDDKWTSGKYKIRKAACSYPAKSEGKKEFRPYFKDRTRDIYHCYNDGIYIAQKLTLADAKSAVEAHKTKVKVEPKRL